MCIPQYNGGTNRQNFQLVCYLLVSQSFVTILHHIVFKAKQALLISRFLEGEGHEGVEAEDQAVALLRDMARDLEA